MVQVIHLLPLIVWIQTTTCSDVIGIFGSSASIECDLPNSDTLVWDSADGDIIGIKGHTVAGNSTKYAIQKQSGIRESLVIHNLTLADNKVYRCYDLRQTDVKDLSTLTVIVRPHSINMTSPSEPVSQGSEVTFQCVADGGKPLPDIRWYMIDPAGTTTEIIGSIHDVMYSNGTGRRLNTLTVNVTRNHYNSTFICNVTVSVFYEETFMASLDVRLFPGPPSIAGFDGTYDENETVHVACTSTGSKPTANIMWLLDDIIIGDFEVIVIPETDGTSTVTSYFRRRLGREMNGSVLTCAVTNSVMTDSNFDAIATNVTLLMSYKPNVTVEGNNIITSTAGDSALFRFHVTSRPPPNAVNLLHNGFTVDQSLYKLEKRADSDRYEVVLSGVSRSSAGNYSLAATNRLGTIFSPAIELRVLYKPQCVSPHIKKQAIHVNRSVHLICHMVALPSDVVMTWKYRHTKSVINITTSKNDNKSREQVYGDIDVNASSLLKYTDTYIECYGKNSIGISTEPCVYQLVHPGPPEAPSNCTISYENTVVSFTCDPRFDGGSKQAFSLQSLVNMKYQTVANYSRPQFDLRYISGFGNVTVRICSVNAEFPDQFSCTPSFEAAIPYAITAEPTAADLVNTAAVVTGGIVAFLGVLCVSVVVIYVLRKKQKMDERRKDKVKTHDINDNAEGKETCWNYIFRSIRGNHSSKKMEKIEDEEAGIKVISSTPFITMRYKANILQDEEDEILKAFDSPKGWIVSEKNAEIQHDGSFPGGVILSPIPKNHEENNKTTFECVDRLSQTTDHFGKEKENINSAFNDYTLKSSYSETDIADVLDKEESIKRMSVVTNANTMTSLSEFSNMGMHTLSIDYGAADIESVLNKIGDSGVTYDKLRTDCSSKNSTRVCSSVKGRTEHAKNPNYVTNHKLKRSFSCPYSLNDANYTRSSLAAKISLHKTYPTKLAGCFLSKSCSSVSSQKERNSMKNSVYDVYSVSSDSAICSTFPDNERRSAIFQNEDDQDGLMQISSSEYVFDSFTGAYVNSAHFDFESKNKYRIAVPDYIPVKTTIFNDTVRDSQLETHQTTTDTDSNSSDSVALVRDENCIDMIKDSNLADDGFDSETNSVDEHTLNICASLSVTDEIDQSSWSDMTAYF